MGMLACPEGTYVDNTAHLLHFAGQYFPCDRDIEALQVWHDHALLLSSDTDCLSLWDRDGLVRTARVGVYPQDLAVSENVAYVCGGADGRLHLLTLPDLHELAEYALPGLVERVALQGETAYLLTLVADDSVQAALLRLDFPSATHRELARYTGLPGAITATESGLWIGVSEMVLHLPFGTDQPDLVVEGIGLARRIEVQTEGALVIDALEGRSIFIRT